MTVSHLPAAAPFAQEAAAALLGAAMSAAGPDGLEWASSAPGVYILAALLAVIVVFLIVLAMRRPKIETEAAPPPEAAPVREAEARVLVLIGADAPATEAALSALRETFAGVLAVDTAAVDPAKDGADPGEQTRRALAAAGKARACLVLWPAPIEGQDAKSAGWRLLRAAPLEGAPCTEYYTAPDELAAPLDAAFSAIVAAAAADCAPRNEAHVAAAAALVRVQDALDQSEPRPAGDLAFLETARARASIVLARDADSFGRLEEACEAAVAALEARERLDEEEDADVASGPLALAEGSLERAELQALAARALTLQAARAIEPAVRVLSERVEFLHAARQGWRARGAHDRLAAGRSGYARAVLVAFDRTGEAARLEDAERVADEAVRTLGRAGGDDADRDRRIALLLLRGAIRSRLVERNPRSDLGDAAQSDLKVAHELASRHPPRPAAVEVAVELADDLARRGARQRGAEGFDQVVAIYRGCLEASAGAPPVDSLVIARARAGLGRALLQIGERRRDRAAADEAVTALRSAAQAFEDAGAPTAAARTRRSLEHAERLYSELRRARADA
ncbi:MAG: hypothetical protein PVI23_11215 [Maricaulaceae bacterium]|jgi:hypothetical protein